MSILIVEQKVKEVLEIADYAYVLRLGEVALENTAKELRKSEAYKQIFLA
ncbi:leucine/isoleucine/valine transporter ATP-binding subunit [bacterium BMS3Bbin03]|nr:leucine/isoleucine/valine transporter ATP-binding subunit [bacterium BMS3Bbin03]